MSEHPIYRLLEFPWIFRLQQSLLAPGSEKAFVRKISELRAQLPAADLILDVGCGPASWLFRVGLHPVGLDLSVSYVREYGGHGERAVVGSASELPFPSQQFDGVWSVGLLHHLPDDSAAAAVKEMVRVCKQTGYVVVLDAVMPTRPLRRPLAYVLRRLDRGRFVRAEPVLRQMFPRQLYWQSNRFTFAATGLEALVFWARLDAPASRVPTPSAAASVPR
jgi:SAM-dependent methyltransferase